METLPGDVQEAVLVVRSATNDLVTEMARIHKQQMDQIIPTVWVQTNYPDFDRVKVQYFGHYITLDWMGDRRKHERLFFGKHPELRTVYDGTAWDADALHGLCNYSILCSGLKSPGCKDQE